jgi:hypothetical protein
MGIFILTRWTMIKSPRIAIHSVLQVILLRINQNVLLVRDFARRV